MTIRGVRLFGDPVLAPETRQRAVAEIREAPWFGQADPVERPLVETSPRPLFGKTR